MVSMVLAAPEIQHGPQQEKLKKAAEIFETCPFNTYHGPGRTGTADHHQQRCSLYSREAIQILGLEERVGILKIATTWPLPARLVKKHLASAENILFVEEVAPTLEDNVKVIAAESFAEIGAKKFLRQEIRPYPLRRASSIPILSSAALSSICGVPQDPVPDVIRRRRQGPGRHAMRRPAG